MVEPHCGCRFGWSVEEGVNKKYINLGGTEHEEKTKESRSLGMQGFLKAFKLAS